MNPEIQVLHVNLEEHASQYYKHLSHLLIALLKKFPLSHKPKVHTPFDKMYEALEHVKHALLN